MVRIKGQGGIRIVLPKLGDMLSQALSTVGITEEKVSNWLGRPCNCAERREKLNAVTLWAQRIIDGKLEDAEKHLDTIMDSCQDETPPARVSKPGITITVDGTPRDRSKENKVKEPEQEEPVFSTEKNKEVVPKTNLVQSSPELDLLDVQVNDRESESVQEENK